MIFANRSSFAVVSAVPSLQSSPEVKPIGGDVSIVDSLLLNGVNSSFQGSVHVTDSFEMSSIYDLNGFTSNFNGEVALIGGKQASYTPLFATTLETSTSHLGGDAVAMDSLSIEASDADIDQGNEMKTVGNETVVRKQDVLFGRGAKVNKHPGNKRLHKVAKKFRSAYQSTTSKKAKKMVSQECLDVICNSGGRFLQRINGVTVVASKVKARTKICTLLSQAAYNPKKGKEKREQYPKNNVKKKMEKTRDHQQSIVPTHATKTDDAPVDSFLLNEEKVSSRENQGMIQEDSDNGMDTLLPSINDPLSSVKTDLFRTCIGLETTKNPHIDAFSEEDADAFDSTNDEEDVPIRSEFCTNMQVGLNDNFDAPASINADIDDGLLLLHESFWIDEEFLAVYLDHSTSDE